MTTTTTRLPTGTWTLDPSATTVTIAAKKLALFTIPATLTVASGTIEINDEHRVTNVEIVVDATSYTSKGAKRNEHVVGPDFLDAGDYPTIEFRSGRVSEAATGYVADGTLTIKGQTSPIDVAISDVVVDGDAGSFTATATVDRSTIGVDKMPSLIIGPTLELNVAAKVSKAG